MFHKDIIHITQEQDFASEPWLCVCIVVMCLTIGYVNEICLLVW